MADPWAAFPDARPAAAGGAQDWEPDKSAMPARTFGDRVNDAVNWVGTRATKAATGILGTPRSVADLASMGPVAIGGAPAKNALSANAFLALAPFMPSAANLNDTIFRRGGVPEVSSKTRAGKVADAATEGAMGALMMPGNVLRTIFPAAVGGGAQEVAGQLTEGTPWEPAARIVAGVGGGLGAAVLQNAAGNVLQGVRNLRPNVDQTAAKIVGRGLTRDQMTGNQLADAQAGLGPGAMTIEAAGPNVRGVLRGSIAAPGAARTTAQDAFDARIEGSNTRTTSALDKNITPVNSLAANTDELSALRAQQSAPAYQAAGIPDRIKMTETTRPGEPVTKRVPNPDFPHLKSSTIEMTEPGAPVVERTFNTPNFSTPELDALIKASPDVQTAMNAARRLPEYQHLPNNAMALLDKAYKHLNGMEQEAIRAGNGTRAHDLKHLRQDFQKALTDANPAYQTALDAYAGPSKLIDASERAKEWFAKNVDPVIVTREYEAMKAAGLDDAARIGVRDWARTVIGRSDRGVAAERVWNGGDNRARLQAILSPSEFKELESVIGGERNLIKTARDTNVGSRTTPMALEAADNALQVGDVGNILHGRFTNVLINALGGAMDRVASGRTEAVNARIAEMLTQTDPAKVGLVNALMEQARLRDLARSQGRFNALAVGSAVPAVNALAAGDRR